MREQLNNKRKLEQAETDKTDGSALEKFGDDEVRNTRKIIL